MTPYLHGLRKLGDYMCGAEVDDVVAELPINPSRFPALTEQDMAPVKHISADTGARIYVPPLASEEDRVLTVGTTAPRLKSSDLSSASDDTRIVLLNVLFVRLFACVIWQLEGTIDEVAYAFELIANRLSEEGNKQETASIEVPSKNVGLVVGRNQSHLQDIYEQTGALVTVKFSRKQRQPRGTAEDGNGGGPATRCVISGPKDSVQLALAAVGELADGLSPPKAFKKAQARMREHGLPVLVPSRHAFWLSHAYQQQQQLWLQANRRQE